MDRKSIESMFSELTTLLLQKNEDYGRASFDLGLNGNMVHLWDKVKRYRTLVENTGNQNYERIEDTLRDIIGYSIIGLHILGDDAIEDKYRGKD